MYDADFAHALRIIQEKSGCRVLLEPLTDKPPAIPAAAEPVPATEPAPEVKPEPPATYMTVRDFALAAGCSTESVYYNLRKGGLADAKGKIDGKLAVNSIALASWAPKAPDSSKPKAIRCVELNRTFPSIAEAARQLHLSASALAMALQRGSKCSFYHFEPVVISGESVMVPIPEIAQRLHCTPETVKNRIYYIGQQKHLKKDGGVWYFPEDLVDLIPKTKHRNVERSGKQASKA